jgi:signal peptidase II
VTAIRADRAARRIALTRAVAVLIVVIGLDQLTKHTIGTSIKPDQVTHVVGGALEFVNVRNTGVAFGFLAGGGAVVYIVTLAALLALLGFLLARPQQRLLWLPTGMLIGGAISNLVDRIARGSVIDFIKLPHWPAFNVADMSITFGVIILVLVIESASRSHGEQ